MHAVVLALTLVACSLRLASAGTGSPPEYPLAITDRPILLYPGMTELNVSEGFETRLDSTVDAMGKTITTTGLFEDRSPNLSVSHAFGVVEVYVGLGVTAYGGVRLNTGSIPAVVSLSVSFTGPQKDPNYYYRAQSAFVDHKVVVSPGRFAVYAGAGVSLLELSSTLDTGMVSAGHSVRVGAAVTAEAQLTRRLGIYASVHAGGPVSHSSNQHDVAVLTTSVQLLLAFHKWDFYGDLGVSRASSTLLPYLSFGFAKRWGR